MTRLVRKLYDFVFYRWAVSRTDAFDLPRIERRLGEVRSNRIMHLFGRVADIALDLFLLQTVSRKRERHRHFIARLRLERAPVNCSAIQPWRGSGLQAT